MSSSAWLRINLFSRLYPLRAARRADVLARRANRATLGNDHYREASSSAATARTEDAEQVDRDVDAEYVGVTSMQEKNPAPSGAKVTRSSTGSGKPQWTTKGRRTGYGQAEGTGLNKTTSKSYAGAPRSGFPAASTSKSTHPIWTKKTPSSLVQTPPFHQHAHIPPPIPATPENKSISKSRTNPSKSSPASSTTESSVPPLRNTDTHRRREEEDFEQAVRMETRRRMEGIPEGRVDLVANRRAGSLELGSDRVEETDKEESSGGMAERVEIGASTTRGSMDSSVTASGAPIDLASQSRIDLDHGQDHDYPHEPPSPSLDLYRHWQVESVEKGLMREIKRGGRVGQRTILPTLLDKTSKIKLAQHAATEAAQTVDTPELAPAADATAIDTFSTSNLTPLAPKAAQEAADFIPLMSVNDEAAMAMDASLTSSSPTDSRSQLQSSPQEEPEINLKLKLSRKGEAEVKSWIRGEVEEAMAGWPGIGEELAQKTSTEQGSTRPSGSSAKSAAKPKKASSDERLGSKFGWQAPLNQADLVGIRDADSPDATLPDVDQPVAEGEENGGIRRNPVGVQLLSASLHRQLFPGKPLPRPPKQIIDISLAHLADNGLSPTATSTAPEISFDMPPLLGENIREHFHALGRESAEPYLSASLAFAKAVLPQRPKIWAVEEPGWTRYSADGPAEKVKDLGGETMICFDVETMYLKSPYAVMATAVTPNAWYSWISPALFAQPGEVGADGKRLDHARTLIPLTRSDGKTPAVIVGHNVGYDRARVADEYHMELSNNRWLDTLSLHVATKGITTGQRPAWQKRKKEKTVANEVLTESQMLLRDIEGIAAAANEDFEQSADNKDVRWEDVSGPNSLASVADLHCGIKISKDVRNRFGDPIMDSATDFVPDLQLLMDYCASDVYTTHAVLSKVLPLFLQSCPHPASFAGALGMGNPFLPIDGAWAQYLQQAEAKYQENLGGVQAVLAELAYKLKKRGPVTGDLWTEQLDWSEKVPRWTTEEVEGPSEYDEAVQREAEGQDLVQSLGEQLASPLPMALTITPEPTLEAEGPSDIDADLDVDAVWEPHPDDWRAALSKWMEEPPHANTYGDILPYVLEVTYLGYPLVSHPEYRWIVRVPTAETDDPRLGALELLNIPTTTYAYYKPGKTRLYTPFGKTRAKEWRNGQFDSTYRAATDRLIAGASRKSASDSIEVAVEQFAQTPRGTMWEKLRKQKGLQANSTMPVKVASPSLRRRNDAEWWPRWFHDLTLPASRAAAGELDLTVRKRIAPVLLRMAWKGYPLAYSREHGWTYRVDSKDPDISSYSGLEFAHPADARLQADKDAIYCKVPHASGEAANVGNPLSKNFLQYIANGTLASATGTAGDDDGDIASAARHAMQMNAQCSYWTSARERIMGQMAVYAKDIGGIGLSGSSEDDFGMILPQVITMGTVTRRAVESTWLTASNAKKNRVGSELKAMIRAPPGYAIVGADVDSEELWIASVMGDAQFGMHGASAIGWMTLEGTKAAGTDLHSKTANILGTSRDYAKVFNYSRIYGAGVKHAMQLLVQNNADLPLTEAKRLADELYAATKGKKSHKPAERGDRAASSPGSKHMWYGGSESYLFNTLEAVAYSGAPMTPGLGAGVTTALRQKFLPKDGVFGSDYLPSRINWVVQSSGVDYLHMLVVSMDYLIKRYGIAARYMISVHDEVRYIVKEEDKYRVALALQIANTWTRTLLSFNLGLDDLPQGVAFFSAVDIDHVFRKEVDMTCVTPSHSTPLEPGVSLGIEKLLEITAGGQLGPAIPKEEQNLIGSRVDAPENSFTASRNVFPAPDLRSHKHFAFLDAQASRDPVKVRRFLRS